MMVSDLPVIRTNIVDEIYDLTVISRIWNNVKEDKNGCQIWQLWLNHNGHGTISYKGENRMVYQISYILIGKKQLTPGLVLHHTCENPACVNSDHLVEITNKENVLRGNGPTAVNARKVVGICGHSLAEDNIYRNKNGGRMCRPCHPGHFIQKGDISPC